MSSQIPSSSSLAFSRPFPPEWFHVLKRRGKKLDKRWLRVHFRGKVIQTFDGQRLAKEFDFDNISSAQAVSDNSDDVAALIICFKNHREYELVCEGESERDDLVLAVNCAKQLGNARMGDEGTLGQNQPSPDRAANSSVKIADSLLRVIWMEGNVTKLYPASFGKKSTEEKYLRLHGDRLFVWKKTQNVPEKSVSMTNCVVAPLQSGGPQSDVGMVVDFTRGHGVKHSWAFLTPSSTLRRQWLQAFQDAQMNTATSVQGHLRLSTHTGAAIVVEQRIEEMSDNEAEALQEQLIQEDEDHTVLVSQATTSSSYDARHGEWVQTTSGDGSSTKSVRRAPRRASVMDSAHAKVLNMIRSKVSKKKKRFKEGGFDLDLSYITPQIIAMGFPSEGKEALYRNPRKKVVEFLASRHGQKCKVYNLCSERVYDASVFDGRCAHYPFDDHNPPPFGMITDLCIDMSDWLQQSSEHVVALHCKAGKGRTGTIICCALMWLDQSIDCQQALSVFGRERTYDGKGVTIPSQRRYIQHFHEHLKQCRAKSLNPTQHRLPLTKRRLILHRIVISSCPHFDADGGCDPYFIIKLRDSGMTWRSRDHLPLKHMRPVDNERVFDLPGSANGGGVELEGDVLFTFFDADSFQRKEQMFHFWFNTSLLLTQACPAPQEGQTLSLLKQDIDGSHNDKRGKFDAKFSVELYFR